MKKKRAMSASRESYEVELTGVEVGNAKMYGAKYHTIIPYFNYNSISGYNYNSSLTDIFIWCLETFGDTDLSKNSTPAPGMRWYYFANRFLFRQDGDLTLFLLRWGR